jgi:hypothetical protein
MSAYFRFIATKTTYATTIPLIASGISELTRRVRGALLANNYPLRAGELRDFPLSSAQSNMILCDGSEVAKLSFPELFTYLGDSQGVAADPLNFKLPNYVGAATPATVYPIQVVTGSDVNTGGLPTIPTQPGQTGGATGGNPSSGGRPQRINFGELGTQ